MQEARPAKARGAGAPARPKSRPSPRPRAGAECRTGPYSALPSLVSSFSRIRADLPERARR
jgi:hypothetical protein